MLGKDGPISLVRDLTPRASPVQRGGMDLHSNLTLQRSSTTSPQRGVISSRNLNKSTELQYDGPLSRKQKIANATLFVQWLRLNMRAVGDEYLKTVELDKPLDDWMYVHPSSRCPIST